MNNTASTMSNPSIHVSWICSTYKSLYIILFPFTNLFSVLAFDRCILAMLGIHTGMAENWHIADACSQAPPSLPLYMEHLIFTKAS